MPNEVCLLGLGRGPLVDCWCVLWGVSWGVLWGVRWGVRWGILKTKKLSSWNDSFLTVFIVHTNFSDKYSIPDQCAGTSKVSQLCR